MDPAAQTALNRHLARRHGVISRAEATALGVPAGHVHYNLRSGLWVGLHRGVYTPAGWKRSDEGRTLAACLAAGPLARASYRSAAWLWGLSDRPPRQPEITVPEGRPRLLAGVTVHRSTLAPTRSEHLRRSVPVTSPVRTVVDTAAVVDGGVIDEVVDRGLARRLFTIVELERTVDRWATHGRSGVPQLRAALERRGFLRPPAPSVLESITLRHLHAWGYDPIGTEVTLLPGVRVDALVGPMTVLEVDGYAYHSSPEAKAADSRRRNALRSAGYTVIEADWITVTRHPQRLKADLDAILVRPGGSARRSS